MPLLCHAPKWPPYSTGQLLLETETYYLLTTDTPATLKLQSFSGKSVLTPET